MAGVVDTERGEILRNSSCPPSGFGEPLSARSTLGRGIGKRAGADADVTSLMDRLRFDM
jgi:hypothetical protein